MLSAVRLAKELGGRLVLREVTLHLEAGECLVLFGANGAGKTTLLHLLTTLIKPTAGEIRWKGKDISHALRDYRRSIGYVAHEPMLYADWTGRENLDFFGRLYDVRDGNRRRDQLLEEMGLTAFAEEPVRFYSRGMVQRLTLARAFLHSPRLLFLDEAFTGLDASSQERLLRRIESARHDGVATLLVTHDGEIGLRAGTRFALLRDGVLQELSPESLQQTLKEEAQR